VPDAQGDVEHRTADQGQHAAHQRILALADPEHGVGLLRQLRGDGRDEKGHDEGGRSQCLTQGLDLFDEDLGAHDDADEGHPDLYEDAVAVGHLRVPVEVQGLRVALEVTLAAHRLPDVVTVEGEESNGQREVKGAHVDQAGAHGQRMSEEEMAEVAAHDLLVDGDRELTAAASREDDDRRSRDDHRQARQHERRPQDGADADVVGGLPP